MSELLGGINLTEFVEEVVDSLWLLVPIAVGLSLVYVFRDGIADFFRGIFKGIKGK